MLLHTFQYWSLKVLKILNEGIFCNHAVITALLFRSLILVCSRNIRDLLGMSEMSVFVRLALAKPVIKGGKCIYSTMFLWLLIRLESPEELLVCIPSKNVHAVIQCLSIYFPPQYASETQWKPLGLGMVRKRRVISGFWLHFASEILHAANFSS